MSMNSQCEKCGRLFHQGQWHVEDGPCKANRRNSLPQHKKFFQIYGQERKSSISSRKKLSKFPLVTAKSSLGSCFRMFTVLLNWIRSHFPSVMVQHTRSTYNEVVPGYVAYPSLSVDSCTTTWTSGIITLATTLH